MAGTAIKLGLTATSLTGLPVVSNVAGFACGVLDCATGSPVTGAIGIATSVLPCGAWFGKGAGKLIGLTAKGSAANKVLKVGAKVAGNTDHIVQTANAVGNGIKYLKKGAAYAQAGNALKTASNAVKVVNQ